MKSKLTFLATVIAAAAILPVVGCANHEVAAPVSAHVDGQKIDSGLGDLPHYRDWKDKTGRDPMGTAGKASGTVLAAR